MFQQMVMVGYHRREIRDKENEEHLAVVVG